MTKPSLPTKDPSDYRNDTLWNLTALAIQAASGAGIVIGLFFYSGSEYLGIFSQFYAIFVVAGQFFVFGIHDSVLKHSAEYYFDKIESDRLAFIALALGSIGAVIGFWLVLLGANFIAEKFYSQKVQFGLIWMAPGIFLFVLNKVLLGLLCGRQKFKQFSIAQALRSVSLALLVSMVIILDISAGYLGACFTFSELMVLFLQMKFVFSIWQSGRNLIKSKLDFKFWAKSHLTFGALSMPHGFLSESFIRVDILVLAFFIDDAAIGVYSFAAFFVEGIYQISILFRNITNPRLVRLIGNKDRIGLWKQAKKSSGLSILITILLSIFTLGGFLIIGEFIDIKEIETIKLLMYIIFPGLIIYSLFVPFDYALLQGGKPSIQSAYMLTITLLNVSLNILLIPLFGYIGAAIGTAIALTISGCLLMVFLHLTFNIFAWPKIKTQDLTF